MLLTLIAVDVLSLVMRVVNPLLSICIIGGCRSSWCRTPGLIWLVVLGPVCSISRTKAAKVHDNQDKPNLYWILDLKSISVQQSIVIEQIFALYQLLAKKFCYRTIFHFDISNLALLLKSGNYLFLLTLC